jgi:hypothetical protein
MTDKRSKPFGGKLGIFLGGILLVAAVIAFVSLDGYPPADGDSVGAIGAAKRYRSEQITESDVQLTDEEMVALLQSDEMQKLIRDESFQKAVRDQNWAALMENDYFRRIFLDEQFMRLMVDGNMATRLRQAEYLSLQPEDAYRVFLAQLEEAEVNVRGPRLSQIVADEEFKKLFINHEIVRRLVLDVDLIRQRLDADVVSRQMDLDWKRLHPDVDASQEASRQRDVHRGSAAGIAQPNDARVRYDVDYAKLSKIYLDADVAARNPRLPSLAEDATFKQLFENQEWVRRIVLDVDLAKRFLDVELVRRLRQSELAGVRPEEAYNVLLEAARDAEVATPRVRVEDMATDAEFRKFFDHEMAKTIVLDADFFRPLMEAQLASRFRDVAYAKLHPDEKYNLFLEAVKDASLTVSKDRLLEVAQDAKFATWFKQSEFLQRIVLDDAYARKFYDVALASRFRQAEMINLRPEVNYNTWMQAARDASLASSDRRALDYAADAEFKQLFKNQEYARLVILDADFMRERLDAGLSKRLAEIDYLNLRPEVALAALQSAVADAQLNSPKRRMETVVHDADFMKLFVENGMMRRIVLDQDFARWMREAGMVSRLQEFDMIRLRPEVSYNTFLAAAKDASLAERNARMASWAADAQFKQMFKNMELARTMVLDADMMKLMVDSDFSKVAARADTRGVVTDADYLKKYTNMD